MFLYSISHKSTFMQDKPNKYFSTAKILGIPQKSRLHPDTEQFIWSLFEVIPPKKYFVSKTEQTGHKRHSPATA